MLNPLKVLQDIHSLLIEIKTVVSSRDEDDTILLRHLLGSISLADLPTKDMSPDEYRSRIALVASIFPNVMEVDLKKLVQTQLEFMGKECGTEKQFLFARGTINGILLVLEHFEKMYQAHKEEVKPPEVFDKDKMFAELTT